MTEWNLRSRSHACHQCAAAFADGERCFSCVAPFTAPVVQEIFAEKIAAQAAEGKAAKNPDYVRLDFCAGCWDARRALDWISLWNSPYAAPEPPAAEPLPRLKRTRPPPPSPSHDRPATSPAGKGLPAGRG